MKENHKNCRTTKNEKVCFKNLFTELHTVLKLKKTFSIIFFIRIQRRAYILNHRVWRSRHRSVRMQPRIRPSISSERAAPVFAAVHTITSAYATGCLLFRGGPRGMSAVRSRRHRIPFTKLLTRA